MKRFTLLVASIVALVATSCVQADVEDTKLVGNGSKVSLRVETNGANSRTIADGTEATSLQYAVYDEGWNLLFERTATLENKVADLELDLLSGYTYHFVFWADANPGCYNVDFENKRLAVDYDSAVANSDALDAFYGVLPNILVQGSINKEVSLKRPFAQINFGTTAKDLENAKLSGFNTASLKTSLTVSAYTELNLQNGTVSGYTDEVVFESASRATDMGTFTANGKEYEWISMNYILCGADESSIDVCSMIVTDGSKSVTISYPQAPVRRNWRTNLVGSLLTDNSNIKVNVDDRFSDSAYDLNSLEQIAEGVLYDADTKTFVLTSADGLKWFASQSDGISRAETTVYTANGTFNGYTVKLGADIDLENAEWTPIASGANTFKGTFDGAGCTISNLKITKTDNTPAGLFAKAQGVIKNVTIKGVNINAHYKAGAIVGDGLCSHIEDCTVDGGSVVITPLNKDDGNHAGGIAGYLSAEPTAYVKDCVVKNLTVKAYRDVAAVVGTANGSQAPVISGNTVTDCTVIANQLVEYYTTKNGNVGQVVGRNEIGATLDLTSNSVSNVSTTILEERMVTFDANGVFVVSDISDYLAICKYIATAENDDFSDKTIKLAADLDLSQYRDMGSSNTPIGSTGERDDRGRLVCKPFKGTFDGDGKAIKNLYQSGWDMGYEWGQYGSCGLFAELENATVKNVVIEGLDAEVEGGDISFIAGSATGDCVFENITIKSSSIGTYNNGCGGIIGWSGAGNYTFKNITIESDVVLGGLWGSFDSSIGGVVGQAEPGATYNFENVTINCRIDAYNDVTASYDYYNYRMCGMIIGRCEKTTTIDGRNYPDLSQYNLSFNNVTVNYGTWMNYHYCRAAGARGVRVEPGYAYGGIAADRDHSNDTVHCMECMPFDQLIGGDQYGVKGLPAVDGVTVNYPAEYTCPLCGQQHNAQ